MVNPFRKKRDALEYYTRNGDVLPLRDGVINLPFCGDHQVFIKSGEFCTLMMGISVHLPDGVGALVRINPGLTTVKSLYQDFVEVLPSGFRGDIRIRVQNRGKQVCYVTPKACIATLITFNSPPLPLAMRGLKEVDPVGYNNLPD